MFVVYEFGVGKFGFIYDVMRNEFFWGGKGIGVYKNDRLMFKLVNKFLLEGLFGVNSYFFGYNKYGIWEIVESSMGICMYGCVGFELVVILKGNYIVYILNFSFWDYVVGNVLLEEFGMVISGFFGILLIFDKREYYLVGIFCVYVEIVDFLKKEGWKKVENIYKDDKNG